MTDPVVTTQSKLVTQIRLTGARADFVHAAALKLEISATKFCEEAVLTRAAMSLGVNGTAAPVPPSEKKESSIPFGEPGSRDPNARALGLTTKEYKRRVKLLETAGVLLTPEAVANVPVKPPRAPKVPEAPAETPAAA